MCIICSRFQSHFLRPIFIEFFICGYFLLLQLDCCGWDGPKEFAYNSEPIDDSCYENVGQANSGVVPRPEDQFSAKKMKQVFNHETFPKLASYHATSSTFRMPAAPSYTCGLRRTKSRGSPFWLRLQPCRSCALELRSTLFRASKN